MKRRLKQLVAMVLTGGMLICPTFALTFPDVSEDAEYAEAVNYISDVGIMIGDDQGNFNPGKTVTRAEMATLLCQFLEENKNLSTDGTVFYDVPASHWANKFVTKAVDLGFVSGYGNGYFGPDDGISYEQAVTMIVRAVGGDEEALDAGGYPNGFITVASNNELLEGIHSEIGKAMSRAEIAIILFNCIF